MTIYGEIQWDGELIATYGKLQWDGEVMVIKW